MKPIRQALGFTLVEALVVLAVLAILLGLAVPGLAGLRARQQLQAAGEDVWNSLMLARAQAQLHQQHVTVCALSAAGVCGGPGPVNWALGWQVFVDANRNGQREADEPLLQSRQAWPAGVRMSGNSTVSQTIGYGSDGRSESLSGGFLAGTLTLCRPDMAEGWRIVLNALGRPRLEKVVLSACP